MCVCVCVCVCMHVSVSACLHGTDKYSSSTFFLSFTGSLLPSSDWYVTNATPQVNKLLKQVNKTVKDSYEININTEKCYGYRA